jgi:hypothetical protein
MGRPTLSPTKVAYIHTYMPIRFTDQKPVNTVEYETCQHDKHFLSKAYVNRY